MSERVLERKIISQTLARQAVGLVTRSWFVVAALGHWIFLAYILVAFFPPIAQHGAEGLRGMHLPAGFREGDFWGNLASVSHILLSAIIIGGGPLQLIPAIRRHFPRLHRWVGRSYLVAAVIGSIAGLYMTWTRGEIGDVISHVGISIDGILILIFAALTIRHAVARRFDQHRRWAMRLFMVASAVWFFRVGLMAWAMLTGGVGIDWETFTGPFLYVLGFAQYLLPLAMLEWYFYCQRQSTAGVKIAFSLTLSVLTVYMAVGIFAATMGLWLPRM